MAEVAVSENWKNNFEEKFVITKNLTSKLGYFPLGKSDVNCRYDIIRVLKKLNLILLTITNTKLFS
jgi:hypothetical protein